MMTCIVQNSQHDDMYRPELSSPLTVLPFDRSFPVLCKRLDELLSVYCYSAESKAKFLSEKDQLPSIVWQANIQKIRRVSQYSRKL